MDEYNKQYVDLEYLECIEQALQSEARKSFKAFVLYTFPDYELNWHHEIVINITTTNEFCSNWIPKCNDKVYLQIGNVFLNKRRSSRIHDAL